MSVNLTTEQTKTLEKLKLNLREKSSPFFTDEQLLHYLEQNEWDLRKASYEALIAKAEDDSITLPSGLTVPNNRAYWLTIARGFRDNQNCVLKRG